MKPCSCFVPKTQPFQKVICLHFAVIADRKPPGCSRLKCCGYRLIFRLKIILVPENGFGKKTPVEEYRITNRGGLGIKNYSVTEKTGGVVGVKVVDGSEDLLLVTRAGILIRTPVEAIRTTGRATQGVIVMRFKEEGDSVISMALTEHEESEE